MNGNSMHGSPLGQRLNKESYVGLPKLGIFNPRFTDINKTQMVDRTDTNFDL